MSASWMKFHGMRDDSTPKELRRRAKFAPNLPPLTAKELGYAGVRAWWYWLCIRWNRLRIRLFGERVGVRLSQAEIDALPKVFLTPKEDKFKARWDQRYIEMLGAYAKSFVTGTSSTVDVVVRKVQVGWLRITDKLTRKP